MVETPVSARGHSISNDKHPIDLDERRIDAIFAELDQCHLPGAAVGIAIDGKPTYRKGFGLANIELPVVLSPTIRMRIMSLTKQFTSLAYMLLCEAGKATIHDPIGDYLPELHPVIRDVTMRELMGHLGGLRDVFDICSQFSGTDRPVSSAELLSLYRDIDDLNAVPGTSWIYNNGGYLILGFAIERITGRSLEDVFRERIFEPIGMFATVLRRTDFDFLPESATCHMTNAAGEYEKSNLFGTAWAGEGGIVSTVDDMLRWLVHMETPTVGSTATWQSMKSPQRLANGTSTGYGLGLVADRYRGIETISHAGGKMGCNSYMVKVPSASLDIVIMVNRGDVWASQLAERILDACLPGLDPHPDKEPVTGSIASGIFRSPKTDRVIKLFSKGGHQIASIDGLDMPVEPDIGGKLWPAGMFRTTKQAITLVGDGIQPVSLVLDDFGERR
jgi:CubicO group peptidase (beta-lactamase class C family)